MTAEKNFPVPQVAHALTRPGPSGSPELVARWLRKVRGGAMCGLAVVVSHAAYMVLGAIGIAPGPRLANAIACATAMTGGVGVWLLVSSEPDNREWFWSCRWVLRLAACALVLLCAASMVVYGFFRDLPEQRVNATVWRTRMLVGVGASWVLLCWYLKTLSHRLGDKTLGKNFAVLFWLTGILVVLAVLAVTSQDRTHDSSVETPPATAPSDGKTQRPGGAVLGFSIWMAYYVWMGWLMWRLSRRLNQSAGHYRERCELLPTTDQRPRDGSSGDGDRQGNCSI